MKDKAVLPPQSIDSEQACLGAILIDPGFALNEVLNLLEPVDFYHSSHQFIYEAMLFLNREAKPIDQLSVKERLAEMGKLEQIGGVTYLAMLTTVVPTSGNVAYYAQLVKDKSQLRSLMQVASDIYASASSAQEDVQSIVDDAEKKIFKIGETRKVGSLASLKDLMPKMIDVIENRVRSKGYYTGIPSGFKDLDDMTQGFQKSDLIILAARPSMGKTALALNIASNIAVRQNKKLLFFSLEMSSEQLIQRVLSSEARVDSSRIRQGKLEKRDWQNILQGIERLSHAGIYIEDSPGLSYTDMRAIARRLKAKEGLDFVMIDYLQLISSPGNARYENRQAAVSEISRNLKLMARELDVPVMSLSQLSREVEKRQDKRPILSDLRESGALEQDADLVAFIHRPGYYDKENEALKSVTEIIIAKQRNGPVGDVKLSFLNQYTRFEDYFDEERLS